MAEYSEYLEMLNSDPNDQKAFAELSQLGSDILGSEEVADALSQARTRMQARGAAELAVKLLDLQLEHTESEDKVELLVAKGKLFYDDMLDPKRGLECYQEALEIQPDNEQLSEKLSHLNQVAERWQDIATKLVEEGEGSTENALTTNMFRAAAETYGRFEPDSDQVESLLRRALEVDPRNGRASMQLARLLRRAERWQHLRDHLEQEAKAASTNARKIEAYLGLAELGAGPLEDSDLVVQAMGEVISLDPAHPKALAMLATAYESAENWAALVTLYANALKSRRRAGSPETETDMLIQIGMLHWQRLDDAAAAEEYFSRLRKLQPAHPVALRFFGDYYVKKGENNKLMQIYRQALKAVGNDEPERKHQLMVELAELSEGAMDNPEKAIDSWKNILRGEPENGEARAALRRLYERTGKWNALLDLIKDEVEALPADDVAGKTAGLMEVAAIYRDQLNLDVMVVNTYNSILTIDPSNIEVLDALAQKYEDLGRWNDLIAVLSRKAQLDGVDASERSALLNQVASLWIDRFGNFAQAIKPLEMLLDVDPSNREAIARLKEIYTRRRQWRALIALLGKEAETMDELPRRAHLADMAKLAGEKLGDSRLSIDIWNRILLLPLPDEGEVEPSLAAVYDALGHLYEREKRYLAQAEILHRRRELCEDEDQAVRILERLGALYADRVKAPAQAAEAYRQIVEIRPSHGKAMRVLRDLYAKARDFDAMESLYSSLGQYEELVDAFFNLSDKLEDKAATVALLERAAAIASEQVGNKDKVARVYERLQAIEPNHEGAARALIPLYRGGAKWARLVTTLELLQGAVDGDEKDELIDEIRSLWEERLNSKTKAFEWTAKAYKRRPEDEGLFADLQRLGAEADAWEEVSAILQERLEIDGIDEETTVSLLRELGEIAEHRLHDAEAAQGFQRRILEIRPDDGRALDALEELATHQSEWPALLEILRKRVSLGEDSGDKVDLLFKIAHIEEERQGNAEAAATTYDRIIEIDGENRRALRALARIHEAGENWSGLARVLEYELGLGGDDDTLGALHMRLGSLYQHRLERDADALESYRNALLLAPSSQVHEALETFLSEEQSPEVRSDVARLLLPVFESANATPKVVNAIEILLYTADEHEKIELETRLVRLYGDVLGDPAKAYEAALRLFSLEPTNGENRAQLGALAGSLDRHRDLFENYERCVSAWEDVDSNPGAYLELAAEQAALADEVLDDSEAAERCWRRVLAVDENHEDAQAALNRLLRVRGDWEGLRTFLQEKVERSYDARDRVAAFWEIAELCDGVLEDREGATRAFEGIIEADPEQSRAYDALAGKYEEAERFQELEELLGRRGDYLQGDDLDTNDFRRASLRAHRLEQGSAAVDLCEEVLSRSPDHYGVRALLEQLVDDEALRTRCATILEPVYERAEQWEPLCTVLGIQAEAAESKGERLELLARAATICEERLANAEEASRLWMKALAVEPADERGLQGCLRLIPGLGLWSELVEALDAAVDAADDSDVQTLARLHRASADIARDQLQDQERARRAFEALLDLDSSDPELIRYATAALDSLYAVAEEFDKQAAVLRKQAEWAESSEERAHILARVAEIQELALEDQESAIQTWVEVSAEDPDDPRAIAALERLYEAGEHHRELVEILRRRIDLSEAAIERAELLQRVSIIFVDKLDEVGEGITCLLETLDLEVAHAPIYERLCVLYRRAERFDDLLDVLERRAQDAEGEARAALLYEAAQLLAGELMRPMDALEHYADVLRLNPEHEECLQAVRACVDDPDLRMRAAEILEPLYESFGRIQELVDLQLVLCEHSEDPREILVRRRRVARHQEQELGNPSDAFETMRVALKGALSEPELPELLGELQRLAAELGRLEDLVALYREVAPDIFDGDLQRRLHLDIADLSRAVLQDDATARDYYQLVLDSTPDDARALAALEGLCREAGDHEALYRIMVQKSELAGDDLEARAAALREAGDLCADELDRSDDAIMHWEQTLELIPNARDVAERLQKAYAAANRWHDVAEAMERRLGYTRDVQEAVDLRFRLGELYEDKLSDPDAAVENYGAALSGDPSHSAATTALERMLDEPMTRAAAAEILEPIHVSRQNWPQLVRIYEIKLEASDEQSDRLRITKYIARLYEDQLEDLDGAFHWIGRVFREAPEDKQVRHQLERLASVLQSWEKLATIYQEYLDDESGDTPELRSVASTLAEIYDKRLDKVEYALDAYRRVLQGDPDELRTFAAAESMLIRAERWPELVSFYEENVHASLDDERRQQIYFKLAQVNETRLSDNSRAIDALRALLEINPENDAAIGELDRLLQAQNNWYDLAELLSQQIERAESDEQIVGYRLRLAQLREKKLEDIEGAIEQYEIVLSVPGGGIGLAALERLVVDKRYQERIAEILEPIYRANDWWQKLVVILDAQLAYVDDPHRRGDMLREIAKIHEERGGDLGLALEALSKAWLEDSSDVELYERMVAMGWQLGRQDLLLETLEAGIKDNYDYDLVARALMEMARVYESAKSDNARAMQCLRRLLENTDDHAEALSELDRLLTRASSWDELVPVIERRAELAEEPSVRIEHLRRVASINERERKDMAAAIDAHRNVLSAEPDDKQALDELDRIFRQEENWVELVQVLLTKLELAAEVAEIRSLRFSLLEVYETRLNDAFEAIAQARAVQEMDPSDRDALAALRRLLEAESMWQELLEVLDQEAELSDGEERVGWFFEAAKLVEDKLEDMDSAVERYAGVLDLDSSHAGARDALERCTENVDLLERSSAVLEHHYRGEGSFDRVARLYERRLEAAGDDIATRAPLFAALAELHEMSRADLANAFSVWARALKDDPEDERSQQELERISAQQGMWQALVEVYEERLQDTVDARLEFNFASKLGALYEENIGDLERAASCYQRALGVADEEMPCLIALARIYERDGKFVELAETLARQAEATMDEPEQCALLYRLGEVREVQLSQVDEAINSYSEVLERDPAHAAARSALERLLSTHEAQRPRLIALLEPLYEQDGDFTRLVDLYATKLQTLDDSFERAQLYARIGELCRDELGDPVRAMDAVGGWLAEDPQNDEALEELLRLADPLQRYGEVVARLDGIIETTDSDDIKVRLGLSSAQIKLDKLGDNLGAQKSFAQVLEIESENAKALTGLSLVYRNLQDAVALADVQWKRAELSYDATAKRELYAECARLRAHLGQSDEAIRAWREVMDQEESDREALESLAALYRSAESWQELVDHLSIWSRYAADAGEDRRIRTEIATTYSVHLGELDSAIEAWQSVLDVEPAAFDALDALESLYRQKEDFMAVQDVLMRRIDVVDSDAERCALYMRMAQLAELDREAPEEAIDLLQNVLSIDEQHQEAQTQIERLLRGLERWHDVVELIQKRAELLAIAGDHQGELQCLAQAADIWEGPLENPDAAGEILETILRRDPNSVAALTRLAKIYEGASDWERCSEVLEKALALGPQGRDAADLYVRLGEVELNQSGDDEKAQQYFGQALHFDGYHPQALGHLEKGARDKEDWILVADMVRRRYEICQDPKEKLELTVELAELYGERLKQPETVIPLLEAARQDAPEDPRIVGPLADLYFHAGRLDEAAPMFETLADAAKKKRRMKEVASYRERLGGIFLARGDMEQAKACYEEANRIDPTNVKTMKGLGEMYMASEDWNNARRIYRSMVLQNIDPKLGISKADVYYQLGRIHQALGEAPKAKDMYKRALSADSEHAGAKAALETV